MMKWAELSWGHHWGEERWTYAQQNKIEKLTENWNNPIMVVVEMSKQRTHEKRRENRDNEKAASLF